jgi:phage terminase large subunit-like protein
VSAAADRGQASLIYSEVMAYADAVPWITERLTPRQHNKTITDEETGSTFSALSSDHRKAHGLSPTLAICDEVAQWRGRDLLDALRTGMGAHDEPLLIAISTRSPDPENPLEELLRYGEEADDPTFRAYSWSAPLDADPWAEETWAAANPGLGDFRSKADVEQQAQQARALPSLEPAFRAYVLNQPVASEERFIGPRDWDGCAGTAEPRGPCYAGLDLSSGANDLTSVALYWPETSLLRVWGFIPAEVLDDKAHEDRADYRVWRNRGLVVETPGRAMDKAWLGHWIAEQTEALDLRVIASDRWGLNDLKVAWEREGIELPLEPVGTGFRDMSPAVRSFEAAVLDRRIQHEGNPLLRWAVANVSIEMDASGNRKPSKAKARGRIDPAIAAIQAVAAAGRAPAVQEYDFSGDRVLAL